MKFVADWFVTSKIIEKSHNAVFSKYDIILSYIDSDIVTFLRSHISLDSINLNNTNIDDGNLDDYDPESINHSRHLAWYKRFKQHKACNKQKKKKKWWLEWLGLMKVRRWEKKK